MLRYILKRILVMIPTLILISMLVFTIIELPPGDYFESYVAELRAMGETANLAEIEELRVRYGFDQPAPIRYFRWATGMLVGDFGYSFEYQLPVNEVVGDRLWLTVLVSFVTIIVTWILAFPIGIYSATHKYSWGDYGLTFLGLLGIAIPNFMLALILMYFANIWFGISIGHLMDREYLNQAMSWPKFKSILEHIWIPVLIIGTAGTDRHDPPPARQPLGRVAETICRNRPRQGASPFQGADQIPAAHGAEFLHFGHRLDPARHHIRRGNHRRRAVARNNRSDAHPGAAKPGHVPGRLLPDVPCFPHGDRRSCVGYRPCHT